MLLLMNIVLEMLKEGSHNLQMGMNLELMVVKHLGCMLKMVEDKIMLLIS